MFAWIKKWFSKKQPETKVWCEVCGYEHFAPACQEVMPPVLVTATDVTPVESNVVPAAAAAYMPEESAPVMPTEEVKVEEKPAAPAPKKPRAKKQATAKPAAKKAQPKKKAGGKPAQSTKKQRN